MTTRTATPSVLRVRLLDVPYRIDRDYDYLPPEELSGDPVGRIVLVPFGKGNRPAYAVVCDAVEDTGEHALKRALWFLPEDYRVLPEILRLCFFLREHTLCSVGDAVRAAFPAAALGLVEEVFSAAAPPAGAKSKKDALLAYLWEHPEQSRAALIKALGEDVVRTALAALLKEGRVRRVIRRHADAAPRTKRYYTPALTGEARERVLRGEEKRLSAKALAAFRFLCDEEGAFEEEITERLNISASPLQTLAARGILQVEEREIERNPYALLARRRDASPVLLSRAQEEAFLKISSLYEQKKPACALLHGVTGSGKTKIMIKMLDRVLAEGRQAILLVPEIALTPQTVGIFCSRYGERVSVLHSSLSVGERYDAYRRILAGQTDLVIGTRSAIFAPLSRLSLIIIDEEHEHTYKSDAPPRYHTRDVAAFRSAQNGALTVLASATPTIESYYKAKEGKYTLVPLTERYGGLLLPQTEIVDMREELRAGNTSPISRRLAEALGDVCARGKQAVLFLNRRGYHHTVSCRACGEVLLCPHCSVSFTQHTGYGESYLLCHACGTKRPLPSACPTCGAAPLSFLGTGTQKAEATLSSEIPCARVVRMDADTTATKSAYERILGKFREGKANLLLGTQMVTKGHDFPNVALSGVLLADASLYMHDFRAAERTFSLLTQVIGRAGRAGEVGRAIIQTMSPDHPVIRLAAKQDYPAFYEDEIKLRRSLAYPPFCDVVTLTMSAADEQTLLKTAAAARELLIRRLGECEGKPRFALYGPLELSTYKVAEKYRMRLLVKCRLSPVLRRLFGGVLTELGTTHAQVDFAVDFNPTDT